MLKSAKFPDEIFITNTWATAWATFKVVFGLKFAENIWVTLSHELGSSQKKPAGGLGDWLTYVLKSKIVLDRFFLLRLKLGRKNGAVQQPELRGPEESIDADGRPVHRSPVPARHHLHRTHQGPSARHSVETTACKLVLPTSLVTLGLAKVVWVGMSLWFDQLGYCY